MERRWQIVSRQGHGIGVKALRSSLSRILRLVDSPNAWTKKERALDPTGKMATYKQFWQPLMDELREKHRFTNAKAAQPQSWYSFASGIAGISYGVAFASDKRLKAELYIDLGDTNQNKAVFDFLESQKPDLEQTLGEALTWERLDAKRACRIAIERPDTTIDDAQEQGDEMRAWLVDRLIKLKQVFGPRLRPAIQAVASNSAE